MTMRLNWLPPCQNQQRSVISARHCLSVSVKARKIIRELSGFALSSCFFLVVSAYPVSAQSRAPVDVSLARSGEVSLALSGRIKTVVDGMIAADARHPLSPWLVEAADAEQRIKAEQKVIRDLSELEPSLSLVSSCENSACQKHDYENELILVARVGRVAVEFLSKEKLATHKARLLKMGELLAGVFKNWGKQDLKPADRAQLLTVVVRISDRFPLDRPLDLIDAKTVTNLVDESDEAAAPYLVEALLDFYQASADGRWLLLAEKVADQFISSSKQQLLSPNQPRLAGHMARQALSLFHFTGAEQYRDFAVRVSTRELSDLDGLSAEALLDAFVLHNRLRGKPFHVTVVAPKGDVTAIALFNVARGVPVAFRRLEWWDPNQGKLPNPDVRYPVLKRPAAFICVEQRCSLPLFSEQDIQRSLSKIFN